MAITRTPQVDDDGTGTTGTIWNNAWKTELYNQIDAADAAVAAALPYALGAWTPQVAFGGSSAGIGYIIQIGRWVKVGLLVVAQCSLQLTSKGSAVGAMQVYGLPFPIEAGSNAFATAVAGFFSAFATSVTGISLYADGAAGTGAVLTVARPGAGGIAGVTDADCTNSSAILFTISYRTNV